MGGVQAWTQRIEESFYEATRGGEMIHVCIRNLDIWVYDHTYVPYTGQDFSPVCVCNLVDVVMCHVFYDYIDFV